MLDLVNLWIFLCSIFLVGYPYVVYPLLMALVARRHPLVFPPNSEFPSVSVLVAAYNEEKWIAQKIDSTLSQVYPSDQIEVLIISDGSTDRTTNIVGAYIDPRVKLLVQAERQGKSLALNHGVRESRGDVLVFTDANALFAPDAICQLVRHFADPSIGVVTGQGLYGELQDGTARGVANGYVRMEALIKCGESVLGIIGGADGAIYACRRNLYRDLAPTQVNDLLHPIDAALAGYRSVFDSSAITVEPPSQGGGQEFQRHVRIIAQGFTIFFATAPELLRRRRWKELWVLCSHRLFRWISMWGLVGIFLSSALGDRWFHQIALFCQGGFYSLAFLGWVGEHAGWKIGFFSLPYYFCVVSLAGLLGFFRFLQGGAEAVWNPRGVVPPGTIRQSQ